MYLKKITEQLLFNRCLQENIEFIFFYIKEEIMLEKMKKHHRWTSSPPKRKIIQWKKEIHVCNARTATQSL